MNFFFSDSNDQAATPRKKDLFAVEICVRGNSMKNRTEKKFFQAVYIYIYEGFSSSFFFLFRFRRKGDAVLDEGTNRAKCTLLA